MRQYNKKSIPVYVSGGKIAGCVRGNVFDVRKHSNLLLHTPPAIALSVDALREAERLGAELVQVSILESGRIYQMAVSRINRYSQEQKRGGYEQQHVCPLEYWTVIREGEALFNRDAPLPALREQEPAIGQLSMFG